ncbi:MAG: six-cysteine ranthipeptide SCIFF [Clostridiales bacterium]|jgi:predicted ribosomally synthesized six-cysteine peptide SCIFF|nr:six-cysteine ranthipeptide SCIFF [Clostridiales bacterium]
MKHIQTVSKKTLQSTVRTGGCGECASSCQSACKTSCTVANQPCKKTDAPS